MTLDFQSTLFDGLDAEAPAPAMTAPIRRRELSSGAWVDVARGWLPQPDAVMAALIEHVPWRAERRAMYDKVVAVPRLIYTYMIGEELPHPALAAARDTLSAHYAEELGEPFRTAGCCYYRDGRDSVAWHGDTIGRGSSHDTMVAIVSVGDPRRLHLRPRDVERREESFAVEMGHGDLVVMGGSCQRTWEHAVPKVAAAGPRLSVQFRPFNVF
ncbi:alpha-ketoglutarate-dependent dioxygenase AlkB [Nocardioides sp. zg-ZUI104]|uniref:alpha-ketoglutarate-dependent dioxygenase AlkB n=1 Tax=Nocardioides faecalis TaxID=2803858 RepID=UPI001BCAB8EA|nr:alpha-ketoglutarate-dependent dioxygenase AlkB [Nocardioides faecalis]